METKMKAIIKWLIFMCLVEMSMNIVLFSTCRPVSLSLPIPHHPPLGKIVHNRATFQLQSKLLLLEEGDNKKKADEVEKMIGSRPPSCANKCYGCMPCEPIQVPTTTAAVTVTVQYANYLPEGWKCKCGPTLYTP